jgi:hypothetical protein
MPSWTGTSVQSHIVVVTCIDPFTEFFQAGDGKITGR